MKKILKLLLGLALVFIIAAFVYVNFFEDGPSVTAISTNLGGSIQEIGELATAEYGYTMAETVDKPNKEIIGIKIPFTKSKLIYSYDGYIKAGVDFSSVAVTVDDSVSPVKVSVTLPEAEIISSEVDSDSLVVYDEQNSPFNSIKFEDINLSVGELKKSAEANARENGLMDRALDNAKEIIRMMVNNLYPDKDFEVTFN